MLSKNDLQQISLLLDTKLDEKLQPIKDDVSVLKDDVAVLKTDVSGLKQDVSVLKTDVSGLKQDVSVLKKDNIQIKKSLRKLTKTQDVMLEVLDTEQMHQRKRLTRIEDHLGFAA